MRLAMQIVALAIALSCSIAGIAQESPDRLFARAVELHRTGNLDEAAKAYEQLLQQFPTNVEARSNLGAVYARKGDYGRAIDEYRRALELDRDNAGVRFNLGVAYYQANRIPEAAEALEQVLAAQPENRNAVLLLADCRLRLGENRKTIALLEPLEHQDDRALLYLLGTALIRDNQIARGQPLVDRILRQGDSAEARMLLGSARMMGRDYRGALEELARAAALDPKIPSVHSHYGRAQLAVGDRNGAVESFRRELETNPSDFESNLYMGVLLKQDQKLDEALAYLERALRARPGAAGVRYQIGSLHLAAGRIEDARKILEDLVREEPEFVEAHVSLATVYYRLKRKAEGDRHRDIVQKLNAAIQARAPAPDAPPDTRYQGEIEAERLAAAASTTAASGAIAPAAAFGEGGSLDTLAARAALARQSGRSAEAAELYRRGLERSPSWHEGWWHLGTMHYEEERFAEARDAFSRLTALVPERAVAWAMRGLTDLKLGEHARAIESLEKARALGLPNRTQLEVVSRFNLALLLNRAGRSEEALEMLHALARREGDRPSIVSALGICALALPCVAEDLPADQNDLAARAGAVQYQVALNRRGEARKLSEELVARFSTTPNVHYSHGLILAAEEPDAALEAFRKELRVSPAHLGARVQIAMEYLRRAEHRTALPFAEEAVRLAPSSPGPRHALGRILLELGSTERAIAELEAGAKLAPESPELQFALARAYARAGRKSDAERARAEFTRLDRMRRVAAEGSQAVGGIHANERETPRPPQ